MKKSKKQKMVAEQVVMQLLAYELFGKEPAFHKSEADWQEVLDVGEMHSILALLYPGIKKIEKVPQFVTTKLRSAAILSAVNVEQMTETENRLLRQMEKENINCAVLKGTSVAVYYPHSELRMRGDIDLLVSEKEIEEADRILIRDNFRCADRGSKHHFCYEKDGLALELHYAVSRFPDNPKGHACSLYLSKSLNHIIHIKTKQGTVPVLDFPFQAVALLKHMESHLLVKELRLRQLCDWAVTIEANKNKIDKEMVSVFNQCGLLEFAKVLTKICVNHLGITPQSWCNDASDTLTEELLYEVLDAGMNCGGNSGRYARVFLSQGDTERGKNSAIMAYIAHCNDITRRDFPGIAQCWLFLPAFWLYYPLRYIVYLLQGKRSRIGFKTLCRDVSRRRKLLNKLKLFQ